MQPMQLCSRCHKRYAVVFITKMDQNGKTANEGLCLRCAKDLGIAPVNNMLAGMGLSDEEIDNMNSEMEALVAQSEENNDADGEEGEDGGDSRAPAIDFKKLFGAFPMPMQRPGEQGGNVPPQNGAAPKKQEPKRKYIGQYCMNLNKRALEGKLDNIIGRDRELARLTQILCRRQKNNPCLIGEPGVGKTAIAEALAQRIVAGNVPMKLRDKEVHLVDLTAMVAGTQFRGQFEARMKGLIEEVKAAGNIILVIDEVHSIVGAGDAEGSMNAANILKPALSRGEIQLIGATTLNEYRKYIEKDAALERRFQPIIVEEPSIEDSVEILRGIKKYYESYHGITIPDQILRRAVMLSERYISDRFLPDKAIDLLDEAAAYLALHSPCLDQLAVKQKELAALTAEREQLEGSEETEEEKLNAKYQRLAEIKVDELGLTQTVEELTEQKKQVVLTVKELAEVIEIWTGVPASNITEHEFARLDRLSDRIKERIVGQDEAVDAAVKAIRRNRAGISYKRKPVSFIFAGPTGVGKTELVKTLAAELFDTPDSLIRLDMSEFMEKHSVSRLIGAPPGYVGYDEAGFLTEKIRRKMYSVILFDEIEKAHPDVLNILLQILDDGQLTDTHGRKVNFENTVIIMTTNAGSDLNTNAAGFATDAKTVAEDKTMKALSSFLRPEFLNRVDAIITFRGLNEQDFAEIAHIMLNDLSKVMEEKGIALRYSDEAAAYIAKISFSVKFGARNMRRTIQNLVEDEVANLLIAGYEDAITGIALDVDPADGKLRVTALTDR